MSEVLWGQIWQVTDTLEVRLEVTLVTYGVPVSIDVVPLVYPQEVVGRKYQPIQRWFRMGLKCKACNKVDH